MNYIDIVVGIILVVAIIKGFKNGLIIELASLAALIIGLLGAIKFSNVTENYLSQYWNSDHIGIIAFIITFILIVVGIHVAAKALDKLISAVALGIINRIAGATFSFLKYAFILSVLLAVTESLDKRMKILPPDQKEGSFLYKPLSALAPATFPYLRFDGVKDKVKEATEDINI